MSHGSKVEITELPVEYVGCIDATSPFEFK